MHAATPRLFIETANMLYFLKIVSTSGIAN
jgi:hypothetical protein